MKKDGRCEIKYVDWTRVAPIIDALKSEEAIQRAAELFATMGDPTRVKIIYALSREELCVCDIAAIVGASDSAVSHQLRVLRNMRLVKYRKEGKMAYYCLGDDHVKELLEVGLRHVNE